MNITGVTSTMPSMEQSFAMTGAQASAPVQEVGAVDTPMEMDAASFSVQVSTEVMDMANQAFDAAAQQLIQQMAQMTGVGQNFDARV